MGQNNQENKIERQVPKGCLAIKVGNGNEQKRFVIPVFYLRHPLFLQLLKGAEEEYGFDQKGMITIPCHVDEFLFVQDMILKERRHLHNHHRHNLVGCFRI
ncbi:hypothetical protein ACJIZ3_007560 [Penstemon smallii]|uniref:Uncharacterized protein n=1 Tax=Penstemon smallii TaxID=265156 RepID=A0ABD3T7B5_9LAMI